jgi:formylglycine-generating enzyme required for sulfatase activity
MRNPRFQFDGNSAIERRAILQRLAAGAVGLPGLTLWAGPLGATAAVAEAVRHAPTAKSIIFLSLFGGPPHQDTFDLKEDAPREIRGEFQSIPTSLPGFRVCEYLPKLAELAHLYTVIRSVTHGDNAHESAFYSLMTGWPHPLPNTNARPQPADYPNFGVVLEQLKPPQQSVPGFMLAGGVTSGGIGQTAGFLGRSRAPYVLPQDANSADFTVPDFNVNADVSGLRLGSRRSLLQQFDEITRLADTQSPLQFSAIQSRAFDMLAATRLREAFDLSQEPVGRRDAYGRNPFGQNLLVARRLVEAGVPVVQVNWRNKGDGGLDTHYDNFNQCKGTLLPRLDACLSALLIDLTERGLLDQTLVVAAGEFGRTPKINEVAGRDHWAGCNSIIMAGGGIRSGFIYGSSDRIGAYPSTNPVGPWDVYATMLHCYGVDPESLIHDTTGRPYSICKGTPITAVLNDGDASSTPQLETPMSIPISIPTAGIRHPAAPSQVSVAHDAAYQTRRNETDGAMLMYVAGGEFTMGSERYSIESPPHPVRVKPFWMSRTPVTTAMYRAFIAATGHREQEFHNQHLVDSKLFYLDDHPAVGVSYDDAVAYCRWAGGRLPTEAEWEFAARGTDGREYPWGNEPPEPGRAVYGGVIGHGGKPAAAGTTPGDCSPFGILDMAGNVLEWCEDWFAPYPPGTLVPQLNPRGAAQGACRVLRGGCWSYEARALRATERLQQPPTQRLCLIGIRMVRDV